MLLTSLRHPQGVTLICMMLNAWSLLDPGRPCARNHGRPWPSMVVHDRPCSRNPGPPPTMFWLANTPLWLVAPYTSAGEVGVWPVLWTQPCNSHKQAGMQHYSWLPLTHTAANTYIASFETIFPGQEKGSRSNFANASTAKSRLHPQMTEYHCNSQVCKVGVEEAILLSPTQKT